MQDAAAFTEDFLQPLFQPIVALSVREREKGEGRRGEIMVVKKRGRRATINSINGSFASAQKRPFDLRNVTLFLFQ